MIKYHRHWHTGTHLCWTCNCCRSRNNSSVPFQSTHELQNDFHENSCTVEVFNDSRKGKNKTKQNSKCFNLLHAAQKSGISSRIEYQSFSPSEENMLQSTHFHSLYMLWTLCLYYSIILTPEFYESSF